MSKNKKSIKQKKEMSEEMDKELLNEIARAENEGFSMSQYSLDKKKNSDFKSTK